VASLDLAATKGKKKKKRILAYLVSFEQRVLQQ